MSFVWPETLGLANLPTPIRIVPALTERLGRRVFVKRDDLTGCAASGNKIRKLDFLLAEARESGADVVITAGGVQSNHCRATAQACRAAGFHPHLILAGEEPERLEGNLFLDCLFGAEITFVSPRAYRENCPVLLEKAAEKHRAQGRTPYVIPVGGSNPLGAMGYFRCAEEIRAFSDREDIPFARIYHAAGSGGTTAGLVLGAHAFGLSARVLGINTGEDREPFITAIRSLIVRTAERFSIPVSGSPRDLAVEIIDGYFGEGYGAVSEEVAALIREAAQTTGLLLDPVYTAKAMLGLLGQEAARTDDGDVLFIHTGGIFGLLAAREIVMAG